VHALIELIASMITAVAVAAFAQFGVDLQPAEEKQEDTREVRRTDDRKAAAVTEAVFIQSTSDC